MNVRSLIQSIAGVIVGLSIAIAAEATPYTVTLDTSPLVSGATGPYYVEFQLVDGDGIINNSATISNFNFGAGGGTGLPTYAGGASGSLAGEVTLQDTFFFNSFYQQFNAGSFLSFNLNLTGNYVDPTPDRFTFAILNSSLYEIATTGFGGELLGVDLKPVFTFETYAGIAGSDPALSAPGVSSVPEPSTLLLSGAGLVLMTAIWCRRRSR